MNDDQPPEMDDALDPELLAEIEREFAELTAEIEKINALPTLGAREKAAMIESLRTSWRTRHEGKVRPDWRVTVDAAVDDAVDAVLKDSIEVDVDGNLLFNLRPEALGAHGQPLMNAAAVALRAKLAEVLPGVDLGSSEGKDPGQLLSDTLMTAMQAFVGKGLGSVVSELSTKGSQAFSFGGPIKFGRSAPAPEHAPPGPAPSPAEAAPTDAATKTPEEMLAQADAGLKPPSAPVAAPAPPTSDPTPTERAQRDKAGPPKAKRARAVVQTSDSPRPSGPDMGTPRAKQPDPDAIRVKIDVAGLFGALLNPQAAAKKKTKRVKTRSKKTGPKKPGPKKP